MTKKAYIGISGPLGYDYKNQFEKIHHGESSSPNPIIENAMGVLLFFDEIIFACPQVCPKSMRELEYVKFLSELPDYENKLKSINKRINAINIDIYRDLSEKLDKNNNYGEAVRSILGSSVSFSALNTEPRFLIDHHTHDFYLGGGEWTRASSFDIKGVLFDLEVIKEFDLINYNPIINSNTSIIAESFETKYRETHKLSNELIIRKIPNYINEYGPYHKSIEELRHHKFITEFREHIDDIMMNSTQNELSEIVNAVENSAEEIRKKVFLKHMNGYSDYWGIAKAAGTDVAGFFIPGTGLATEIAETYIKRKQKQNMRWAAFLTELEMLEQKKK